jgi:hypothetical protein
MMPTAPPTTHAMISTVSEWPNALARSRSGTRSWMLASMVSFAMPLTIAVTSANSAAVTRLYATVASTPAAAVMTSPADCNASGRRMRSLVPMAVDRNVPIASDPATTPTAILLPTSRPSTVVSSSPAAITNAK